MREAALAGTIIALLAAVPAVAQDGDGRFTVDHAIDMTRVGGVELSPDGRRVLYTITELDWEDNERDSRLWIANVDGSDARPFTAEEGDGSARWSPDGRWVSFLRSPPEGADGEGRQLWLIRTDGGEARQLTSHPSSVRSYEWSRASDRIVFTANDTLPDDEEKRREDGYDGIFVNEGPNGQRRGSWSNLWWVPIDFDDAGARPITAGRRIVGGFAIHPEGDRVAFTFRTENHRNDQYRSEIALVPILENGAGGPAAAAAPGERQAASFEEQAAGAEQQAAAGAQAAGEEDQAAQEGQAAEGDAVEEGRPVGDITVLTDNRAPESSLQWHPDGRLLFRAPDLEEWVLDQGNLYLMDPGRAM